MAISINEQYPGKTAGVSTAYPYGKARNVTTPSDGTGTPWEAAIVNDDQGFKQALLQAASIIPSGVPDSATASQYLQALVALIESRTPGIGQTWQNVSRSLDAIYTNNTGKPIEVSVCISHGERVVSIMRVSNVTVSRFRQDVDSATGYQDSTHTAIVPNGATYSVTGGSLISWVELR